MKKIEDEKFYTPNDMLKNSKAFPSRQMVLRHIRKGTIKATNFGSEKKPRYVVQGKHIVEYMNGAMSPSDYTKK